MHIHTALSLDTSAASLAISDEMNPTWGDLRACHFGPFLSLISFYYLNTPVTNEDLNNYWNRIVFCVPIDPQLASALAIEMKMVLLPSK